MIAIGLSAEGAVVIGKLIKIEGAARSLLMECDQENPGYDSPAMKALRMALVDLDIARAKAESRGEEDL